ncbi:comB7 lipoprotein [Helicobacter pylori]|nr:comB7 lipoprotein [Helicobacter pylori]
MRIFSVIMGLILILFGCTSKVHEMKKSPCTLHEKLYENRLNLA